MTYRVLWTARAVRDLEEIRTTIALDDAEQAQRYVGYLVDRSQTLQELPERGRQVPEFPEQTLRELILDNYRMVYRIRGRSVRILRVLHSRRDFKSAWKARS